MAVPAGKSWRPCRPKPAGATEPMRMEQTQWRGIAVWELQSADALARISCFGGQLLSWQPAGASEVFWCSPQLQPLAEPFVAHRGLQQQRPQGRRVEPVQPCRDFIKHVRLHLFSLFTKP